MIIKAGYFVIFNALNAYKNISWKLKRKVQNWETSEEKIAKVLSVISEKN